MYEMLKEFIKPELLVLIPVLYLIGHTAKKSGLKETRLPYLLGAVSVLLCGMYVFAVSSGAVSAQSIVLAVFTVLVQGILIAGASVFVGRVVRRMEREKEDK